MLKNKNSLISVSDKSELSSILKTLKKYKVSIISSGGTFRLIKKVFDVKKLQNLQISMKCLKKSKDITSKNSCGNSFDRSKKIILNKLMKEIMNL